MTSSISTSLLDRVALPVVDLLEAKNVSWATYQENMPYLAYQGDYKQTNYFNASAGPYTYYKVGVSSHGVRGWTAADALEPSEEAQRLRYRQLGPECHPSR